MEAYAEPAHADVRVRWFFSDAHTAALQEIATASIRWATHSRPAGAEHASGWRWTPLEDKAFRSESQAQASVLRVPALEQHQQPDIEVRQNCYS